MNRQRKPGDHSPPAGSQRHHLTLNCYDTYPPQKNPLDSLFAPDLVDLWVDTIHSARALRRPLEYTEYSKMTLILAVRS
jgi:hypothetical protein